ncbi:SET domain-containing protein [Massilia sp. CF038]|uniref:SET domain-containing protein n=1 Tax=Massilia sp. CF038 TaxID=1881045 RepID=UPI000914582A|nr:SET domain-containing protein-lysine N-methyltransferase [Massilia sp. CF038]SHG57259.1 hypothetical protein SAMN05428948_1088 [Massilia sp. CF038]
MTKKSPTPASVPLDPVPFEVRRSAIHGNGVFANRHINAGDCITEYLGEHITSDESAIRAEQGGGPVNHTFFFSLADGNVIDGGSGGNDARFINHACEPNCEAYEEEGRVFIYALQDIEAGEELNYNYALIYEERHTPAVKKLFECRCGAPSCTGTMLAPKKRKSRAAAKG